MPDSRTATWKLVLGYTAFALVAFALFFAWTFPSEAARDRVSLEAAARGYDVRMSRLAPGLFGLTAADVEVRPKRPDNAPDDAPEPEPLKIDSIALRPSLFPLGVHVRASAFNGVIDGAAGGLGTVRVKLDLDGLDLSAGNLKAFSGLDMSGTLNGSVDLIIPKSGGTAGTAARPEVPAQPDLGQASGTLTLTGKDIVLNGGAIESIPALSGGFPKIALGELNAKLTFDKGAGKVEALEVKGGDVTLEGTGTIRLARRWDYADTNVDLKFKVSDEARARLGMVAAGLSMLKADPKDPSYRVVKMTGYLGRPNFR
ncbi:MAG: type II secretion system protein GspN [Myxococcaceae bacterium]|nr:type II secretion system protein GspN [Myxococcaceae bacterium]